MNKYADLREVNPISELWRRRKEQRKTVGNFAKRMKMCAGKKAYDSKINAENARKTVEFRNRVYKCPVCTNWHTSSKRKST